MWVILSTICSLLVLICATMLCLCWKKKTEKNDLLGLDGLVTQKNPDENVNHLPSVIVQTVPDITNAADEAIEPNTLRPVVTNNSRRSLPDIPLDGIRLEGEINYEPNGDNISDLYATVEPYAIKNRHTLPNGLDVTRPSISQHSSISQADEAFSPYARLKSEHPYDKVRNKSEHPYARVQSNDESENSTTEPTSSALPVPNDVNGPPRSQRSSLHSCTTVENEIPAATAVAGGIAANQDLPYMTPPITQPNFSGDSQDSSRGYTSITVREPLANIRAQTKLMSKLQNDGDPHYSTVSDDSDDMYTTIQDPNNPVYTSGSETYAQIEPSQLTVAVEINAVDEQTSRPCSSTDILKTDEKSRTPHPPGVNSLKHVTHTHSRQGSSSSSVGNMSSPKPEKRQANSPLPPPPPSNSSPELGSDKMTRNLDDMYAKVQKGKKKNGEYLAELKDEDVDPNHSYETLKKATCPDATEPGYDTIHNELESITDSDAGYEMLKQSRSAENGGYSIVNKKNSKQSKSTSSSSKNTSSSYEGSRDLSLDEPNYESMPSESEHNYATLKSGSDSDWNYESVNNGDKAGGCDPNYESVKYLGVGTNNEPPYEKLQDEDSSRTDSNVSFDRSKRTSSRSNNDSALDPGYETIRSEVMKGTENGNATANKNVHYESDYDGIVQV